MGLDEHEFVLRQKPTLGNGRRCSESDTRCDSGGSGGATGGDEREMQRLQRVHALSVDSVKSNGTAKGSSTGLENSARQAIGFEAAA